MDEWQRNEKKIENPYANRESQEAAVRVRKESGSTGSLVATSEVECGGSCGGTSNIMFWRRRCWNGRRRRVTLCSISDVGLVPEEDAAPISSAWVGFRRLSLVARLSCGG